MSRTHPAMATGDQAEDEPRRFVYVVDGEAHTTDRRGLATALEHAYYAGDIPWTRLYAVDGDALCPVVLESHYLGVDDQDYLHTEHVARADVAGTPELARFTTRLDGRA